MDDGDIAGQKVGQLCQEQGRAQVDAEPLVEKHVMVVSRRRSGEDRAVDRFVALSAASRDDHVHGRAKGLVTLHAGVFERQSGGVDAEPLPGFHLALVTLLGICADQSISGSGWIV